MKFLRDINIKNKKILVRADFNVPLKNDKIIDDFKIQAVLPTIKYLLDQKAEKIILLTHLGRPNGKVVEKLKIKPIRKRLFELINSKKIVLLENIQFNPGEKQKDLSFIKTLAKMADVFVMEAFAQAHRDYASISGLPKEMLSCAGLLMEKEIKALSKFLKNSQSPLAVAIGGAKISTKLKMIKKFLIKADDLVLGGALANTVISAKGFAIGKSVAEEQMIEEVKKLELTNTKLHIPVDIVVSTDISGNAPVNIAPVGKIKQDEMILDIGPYTIEMYEKIIKQAKMIIWNGPMGMIETEKFSLGSERIAQAIADSDGFSVIGGGESVILLNRLNLSDKINHISTGGGAMLNFLAGEKLPGIEALG